MRSRVEISRPQHSTTSKVFSPFNNGCSLNHLVLNDKSSSSGNSIKNQFSIGYRQIQQGNNEDPIFGNSGAIPVAH